MLTSLAGRSMVSCVAVCVLLLFLFPLVQGPFQATHGPNTAFRARRALLILILLIVRGGFSILGILPEATLQFLCGSARAHDSTDGLPAETLGSLPLRC